jgi:hypothetical protein
MKKVIFGIAMLLMISFVFTSCEDEYDKLEKIENTQSVDPGKVKPPTNGAVDPEKVKPPTNG